MSAQKEENKEGEIAISWFAGFWHKDTFLGVKTAFLGLECLVNVH